MRRLGHRGRVDANHAAIVKALRQCGASVQSLAAVGKGCPDLLIGFRGVNLVIEVKDGMKPACEKRLTPDEQIWHNTWAGQKAIAESVEDALRVIG
jgi:hypothetical protein